MKKINNFILLAILISSFLSGCASLNSGVEVAKMEYSPGTRTTKEYNSEWLGLKYTLSNNMIMVSDKEIDRMIKIGSDIFFKDNEMGQLIIDYAKITLVYEMLTINVANRSNIIIMAEKLLSPDITAEQYLLAVRSQLAKSKLLITYNKPTTRIVSGVEFSELSSTIETNGITVNQMMLIKKISNRMAIINLTYSDKATLDTLLVGFSAY